MSGLGIDAYIMSLPPPPKSFRYCEWGKRQWAFAAEWFLSQGNQLLIGDEMRTAGAIRGTWGSGEITLPAEGLPLVDPFGNVTGVTYPSVCAWQWAKALIREAKYRWQMCRWIQT